MITKKEKDKWSPGERAEVVKRPDNLKQEGQFQGRQPEGWAPGDRSKIVKHPDNLKLEGQFQRQIKEEMKVFDANELRAEKKIAEDNLHLVGEFQGVCGVDQNVNLWWSAYSIWFKL